MSPSVDDVLNCLQKYDETHQDFQPRCSPQSYTQPFKTSPIHRRPQHPQHQSRRLRRDPDGEVPPRDEALYEYRRDAGNRSKKPNTQTRHPTGGTHSPPTTSLHGRKTAEGLHRTEIYRRTDQNNSVLAPRLGQITLAKNIRHSTTFT